jgi:hypothetical protein
VLSLAGGALLLALVPMRRDLAELPRLEFALQALIWAAALMTASRVALVPRRGAVLSDGTRAARAALLVAVVLLLLCTVFGLRAESTRFLHGSGPVLHGIAHCLRISLMVALLPLVVGAWLLRRAVVPRAWRVGAALGAASGALGGLLLHAICPIGGPLHLGAAHAGGVIAAAIIGALVFAAAFDRRPPRVESQRS